MSLTKIGRNEPCQCGSGKKHKLCCGRNEAAQKPTGTSTVVAVASALQLAIGHHRAGRSAEAEAIYRQILAVQPKHADALHLLGLIAHQRQDFAAAADLMRRAIAINPAERIFYSNLGNTLRAQNRVNEAVACYRKALALKPDFPEALSNLAIALQAQGCLDEAAECCRKALAYRPDYPEAYNNLGNALMAQGRLDEAVESLTKAAALRPGFVEAHNNLGSAYAQLGLLDEAIASYRRALRINPRLAETHCNLGHALFRQGRPEESVTFSRQAIALKPDCTEAYNNLGNALKDQGRVEEAMACYRQALSFAPDYAKPHNNLGNALKSQGRLGEALECYRQALSLQPDYAEAYSNLLFCLIHDENLDPEDCLAEHRAFAARFEAPLRACCEVHRNDRDPERRLKVGFVSGDLRNHAVANFMEPVWAALVRGSTELWVYSNHPVEDAVTERLRALTPNWRKVAGLSDEALAGVIRADGIDILVDLSGHTAHNRLLTFARKPAPVQATWIGYPSTMGMDTIDYLICDPYIAPPGLYERYYSERFARLPSTGTFEPLAGAPPINPLPALSNGYVTYGSFNRPDKLGESVIAAWSQVLLAQPGSRLLLGRIDDAALQDSLAGRFGRYGLEAARIEFSPRLPMGDYLALHHQVDIVLDSWPYSGGTTTNHALWMGVPVATVRGPSRAHCQSAAVMGRLGLHDWVADDVAGFVRIGVDRARDLDALATLRAGMRDRWSASPLWQGANVGRWLESAFRAMWRRWCEGLPPAHFAVEQTDGHD